MISAVVAAASKVEVGLWGEVCVLVWVMQSICRESWGGVSVLS